MFNSSPIESWDGASAFFSFAGGGMTSLWFWVAVLLCVFPLIITMKTENHHENQHKFRSDDSDSTHGVQKGK